LRTTLLKGRVKRAHRARHEVNPSTHKRHSFRSAIRVMRIMERRAQSRESSAAVAAEGAAPEGRGDLAVSSIQGCQRGARGARGLGGVVAESLVSQAATGRSQVAEGPGQAHSPAGVVSQRRCYSLPPSDLISSPSACLRARVPAR